jgi:hypothetical protein
MAKRKFVPFKPAVKEPAKIITFPTNKIHWNGHARNTNHRIAKFPFWEVCEHDLVERTGEPEVKRCKRCNTWFIDDSYIPTEWRHDPKTFQRFMDTPNELKGGM